MNCLIAVTKYPPTRCKERGFPWLTVWGCSLSMAGKCGHRSLKQLLRWCSLLASRQRSAHGQLTSSSLFSEGPPHPGEDATHPHPGWVSPLCLNLSGNTFIDTLKGFLNAVLNAVKLTMKINLCNRQRNSFKFPGGHIRKAKRSRQPWCWYLILHI